MRVGVHKLCEYDVSYCVSRIRSFPDYLFRPTTIPPPTRTDARSSLLRTLCLSRPGSGPGPVSPRPSSLFVTGELRCVVCRLTGDYLDGKDI